VQFVMLETVVEGRVEIMGVLACARTGCSNVMCDRYSREHGYICDSCFKELVESGVTDYGYFMETRPGHLKKPDDAFERANAEFPLN
jgi:hypothetical protein